MKKADALLQWRENRKALGSDAPPLERLDPIQKARKNPKSLRAAVNAACWDCMGADFDPNPRGRIRNCPCQNICPLYPVRPYQKKPDQS